MYNYKCIVILGKLNLNLLVLNKNVLIPLAVHLHVCLLIFLYSLFYGLSMFILYVTEWAKYWHFDSISIGITYNRCVSLC